MRIEWYFGTVPAVENSAKIHMNETSVYGSVFYDVALLTALRAHIYTRYTSHSIHVYSLSVRLCAIRADFNVKAKNKQLTSISTQSTSNRWSRRLCILLFCLQETHTHINTYKSYTNTCKYVPLCICVTNYKNRRNTNKVVLFNFFLNNNSGKY